MTLLVVIGPVAAGKSSIARLIAARTGIRNVPLDLIFWDYFCRVDWLAGEIDVGGPDLARCLSDIGLLDEYRLYFHPDVLGSGTPFFAGPRQALRLLASDPFGEDVIRLTYIPA